MTPVNHYMQLASRWEAFEARVRALDVPRQLELVVPGWGKLCWSKSDLGGGPWRIWFAGEMGVDRDAGGAMVYEDYRPVMDSPLDDRIEATKHLGEFLVEAERASKEAKSDIEEAIRRMDAVLSIIPAPIVVPQTEVDDVLKHETEFSRI